MKRRALAALLGIALLTACTIVTGLHTPEPGPQPPPADPCQHALYPSTPLRAAEPGEKEIVVAVRKFDLGLAEKAPAVGFDLDRTCTTCGGDGGIGETCAPRDPTIQHCDDEQGRDNAARTLFQQLQVLKVDIEASLNANVESGLSTLLLRVQKYNGVENDSDILVSIFGSSGLRQELDDGGTLYSAAAFDGGDSWSVSRSQLLPSVDPYVSTQARQGYVSGRTLVVPHASVSIPLREGVSVDLTEAVIVATIDPSGTTITGGTIAGRWPVADALHVCGEFSVPDGTDRPICDDPAFDSVVKPHICGEADLTAEAGAPASTPCDALSIAFAFTTVPALLGEIIDRPLGAPRCQDASIFHCGP
jgi:hypothetical protein